MVPIVAVPRLEFSPMLLYGVRAQLPYLRMAPPARSSSLLSLPIRRVRDRKFKLLERISVGGLSSLFHEFDPVEIDDFSADDGEYVNLVFLFGRTKLDFDFGAHSNFGGGKHVHSVLAQVEGGAFDECPAYAYLDRNGEPSTL